MGASSFITVAHGPSAQAAFQAAVSEARRAHGGRSYTGSVAEKRSFVVIPTPEHIDATEYAARLLDSDDPRVANKWGPAACIDLGSGGFLFFGWAPS